MCIGPRYRINRLIQTLVAEKEALQGKLRRARNVPRRIELRASVATLEWSINLIRLHADGKVRA